MSDASVWCKTLNNNDLSYTKKSWFIHIPCILKKISRVTRDTSLFCEPKLVFLLATQPMHEPWCNFSDTTRDVLTAGDIQWNKLWFGTASWTASRGETLLIITKLAQEFSLIPCGICSSNSEAGRICDDLSCYRRKDVQWATPHGLYTNFSLFKNSWKGLIKWVTWWFRI